MTQSEKSKQIEKACDYVRDGAKKTMSPPKNGIWHVHILTRKNRKTLKKLMDIASEKYGVDKEILTKIILR